MRKTLSLLAVAATAAASLVLAAPAAQAAPFDETTSVGTLSVQVQPSTTTPDSANLTAVGDVQSDTYGLGKLQLNAKDVLASCSVVSQPPGRGTIKLKYQSIGQESDGTIDALSLTNGGAFTASGTFTTGPLAGDPWRLSGGPTTRTGGCEQGGKSASYSVAAGYAFSTGVDPDRDRDGVPNEQDAFPDDPAESVDTDRDGIGNNRDTDDDNDGVLDVNDPAPLDPTIPGQGPQARAVCDLPVTSARWQYGATFRSVNLNVATAAGLCSDGITRSFNPFSLGSDSSWCADKTITMVGGSTQNGTSYTLNGISQGFNEQPDGTYKLTGTARTNFTNPFGRTFSYEWTPESASFPAPFCGAVSSTAVLSGGSMKVLVLT